MIMNDKLIATELMKLAKIISAEDVINDNKFWNIVDVVEWDRDWSYERIRKMLVKLYSKKQLKQIEEIANRKADKLEKVINKWMKENKKQPPYSDDSYSDLRYHIIGLGKEIYDAAIDDPSRAYRRAVKEDYVESFSYALRD